jgi:hypothetical protein
VQLSIAIKKEIDGGIGRRKATIDVYRYAISVALDIVGEGPFFAFLIRVLP